jgi:hypothetical protein
MGELVGQFTVDSELDQAPVLKLSGVPRDLALHLIPVGPANRNRRKARPVPMAPPQASHRTRRIASENLPTALLPTAGTGGVQRACGRLRQWCRGTRR